MSRADRPGPPGLAEPLPNDSATARKSPEQQQQQQPRQPQVLPVVPKSDIVSDTSSSTFVFKTLASGEFWRGAASPAFWRTQCLGTAVVAAAGVSGAIYWHRTRSLPVEAPARRMARLKAVDRSLLGCLTTLALVYLSCPAD